MGRGSAQGFAEERSPAAAQALAPLVVDLDGTLIRSDTLDESFASAFFRRPFLTLWTVIVSLLGGRAQLKAALCRLGPIEAETLPFRHELIAYLADQKREGRELHLATAAHCDIAERVAASTGLFDQVFSSDGARNLKGRGKAEVLAAAFPDGFAYAGDSRADLAVWACAKSGVVVGSPAFAQEVASRTPVERHIERTAAGFKPWIKAARPHQWSKNAMIVVPVVLGWNHLTLAGGLAVLAALVLFSLLSSLTYVVNDIADLAADRRHPTKRARPFASGALPVRYGLVGAIVGIPAVLTAAWFVAPPLAACMAAYGIVTVAYSSGLKRIPILDCFIIGSLFTLRLIAGITAASLIWSPWLLTFAASFFFSLALAKRHTELVGGGPAAVGPVPGRGYRYEDRGLTLVFGIAAATASIIILVLYLMEEVFPQGFYGHPQWLWAAPPILFLWVSRIWLLANRGEMHDDPVVFALKDRVSLGLGAVLAAAFLLALV
ncbi:UbiA family prenyltransferase [Phenylobacterium sp.]|uniref:UbiA family prenyltransferase n=1 Tax=Phenylobacterium sp. TaxID=1871053 RepID=UPI002F94C7A8